MREDVREQATARAHGERSSAREVLDRHDAWQDADRKQAPGPVPIDPATNLPTARPTHAEVRRASDVLRRYGNQDEIAIDDRGVERFVRESGDASLTQRWERTNAQGLGRREIADAKRHRPTDFKRRRTVERSRYRAEQRFERRRRRVTR
jgi:hypothetical protein